MMPFSGRLRRGLFGLSLEEARFSRRGFWSGEDQARRRLEDIGRTFLRGYHAALEEPRADPLGVRLDHIPREDRGFAFEGAAMGLSLLDALTPWNRDRFRGLLNGPGASHVYMVHVGLGWMLARLRRRVEPALARLDPLLGWLAIDGYGFHQGYFHASRYVEQCQEPEGFSGYSRRAFDQGLGRSLWFVECADVDRILQRITAFPSGRQPDLWSGVGLACAYAGGVRGTALGSLVAAAGPHRPYLAQGAAFAAKARQRAENLAAHTEAACEALCSHSADEAARITDAALLSLPPDGPIPAFEIWRRRIQAHYSAAPAVAGSGPDRVNVNI